MALSATVVAVGPGAAQGVESNLRPPGQDARTVRFEPLASGPDGLVVTGAGAYRGAVEVVRNGRSLAVLNDVALEDYVRGIDEVPPSWPAPVLQAQAIAARTYAAHRAASSESTPWRAVGADICATPRCQVYRGLDAERKARGHGWLAAVEATAGRVLLEGGRPILASYSATANGPRAMSQNGALAMAMEGASATDILGAYYGIRPSLAPHRLPGTIRVALSLASADVVITATRPLRVVDGNGAELAPSAAGEWKVVASDAGLRTVPPEAPGAAPSTAESPAVPIVGAEAAAVRRPARVVTASAPLPATDRWATVAIGVLLLAGAATITVNRRRRA